MKSLAHVHFRTLLRLADIYGEEHFLAATTRAQDFRRFNAEAVRRILEHEHPLPESTPLPKDSSTRAQLLLGDVDPGTPDQFAHLDRAEGSETQDQENNDEEE